MPDDPPTDQPYNFIQDYLFYNSGNMVPKRYHYWAAVSVLGMILGRKVFLDQEYYRIYTDNYICLVGRQGIKKTSAKDCARDLVLAAIPNYPIGASVTSREKIVERLSLDQDKDGHCFRYFTDETGSNVEWHPLAFFINELKNFMSINICGMVEFLTDIYGQKYFDADTIKHGLQPVINPCINILACETPKWIVEKLKLNIIAGGFSRRMIYVYETEDQERIAFPKIPFGGQDAWNRCVSHLQKLNKVVGPFRWDSQETKDKFSDWFRNIPRSDDEILRGFWEAKDVLVLKIAMCLAMADWKMERLLTWDLIESAIQFLFTAEEHLAELTVAAGRNELNVPTQELLKLLEDRGNPKGVMPEKTWHREATRNLTENEYQSVKRALKETEQIFELNFTDQKSGQTHHCIVSARKYYELAKENKLKSP